MQVSVRGLGRSWQRSRVAFRAFLNRPSFSRLCSSTPQEDEAATQEASSGGSPATYGAEFVRYTRDYQKLRQIDRLEEEEVERKNLNVERDPSMEARLKIRENLRKMPGHLSWATAYSIHLRDAAKLGEEPLDRLPFIDIYQEERRDYRYNKKREQQKRGKTMRLTLRMQNPGYTEPEEVYEITEREFTPEFEEASMAEDRWKAEAYDSVESFWHEVFPEREPLAYRSSQMEDVLPSALRQHYTDQNRPVLTHELADYANPYMMKRSAMERLLHKKCVRNPLEERMVHQVLDRRPDLVKLRARARAPPEVLEPLMAFRGDARWNHDPQELLLQKLLGAESALDAIEADGQISDVVEALPENIQNTEPQPGINHPWRNHDGFKTAAPHGVTGGISMGRPTKPVDEFLQQVRYPTLQRVAHTLPQDKKWRAHVVQTIRVLERAKGWDFESKLRAVNTMKEIYDNIRSSKEYTAALDEKLPYNRVPTKLQRRYAPGVKYVRRYAKDWKLHKQHTHYVRSLTTPNYRGLRKAFVPLHVRHLKGKGHKGMKKR